MHGFTRTGYATDRSRPRCLGSRRLVEIAVSSLATDWALLPLGVPGTAVTPEESLRYGWNHARLLAEGRAG